jgi:NAD-dependent DNA ligase
MYSTEGGTAKLYTRGNGKVGQDISRLLNLLKLPKTENMVVRGEFIMSKAKFKSKYASSFANARNLVAGNINRLSINDVINDIDFVAYEVIVPSVKPSEQMKLLETSGFNVVKNETRDSISNVALSELLVQWRESYEYEMDGVIVANDAVYKRTDENPKHAFAFKMVLTDQIAEAKVVDVIWNASKDGYLKPRVQIEPIHLVGVKIEYATGFNGAFIETNKIGIGAVIQIIRSGDVIPHIKKVIQPASEAKMPTVPYKWTENHVDIVLENAETDETVLAKNITGFFRGIEVEGLSSGNISRIIDAGFDSVSKILKMSVEDFKKVEGFKEKMANKLQQNIQTQIAKASLADIMSASNLFGRGFSDKKIQLIMENIPNILTSSDSDESKINKIAEIKGMSKKTAEPFVSNIARFLEFLTECGLTAKLNSAGVEKNTQVDASHPLYKQKVIMSGTRDKDLEKRIEEAGGILGSSVSKTTFVVITPEPESTTGKVSTARELGVQIMTPEEFRVKYFS